jgi:pyruvate/2-oxoglutarate dehydrogenase complex dihydrolipoamide dehydrogenase (E3) component
MTMEFGKVLPSDTYNQELVNNVHPPDWANPEPAPKYNVVVIGAGSGGLVTAVGAAGLGAKVALVERHLLGGDCLNYGCVPSKCVIRSSRVLCDVHDSDKFGIKVPKGSSADFAVVMERMRRLRARISHHDSAQRFQDLGVDVFIGEAQFTSERSVQVNGANLNFHKAVIATGARPVTPKLEGLEEAGFLNNETVFSLTKQPRRLGLIGGGPLGCELAQAFQRLGSQVVVFDRNPHLLPREDSDAAEILQNAFIREGIQLVLNCNLKRVEKKDGEKIIHFESDGKADSVAVDEILIGAGRAPNVEGIGLEEAGVEYDERKGVTVNDYLQTTNPHIYAVGDACLKYKFTHTADASARIVLQNALFFRSRKLSSLVIPWCTYTDPEIAHVGLYEADAKEQGIDIVTYKNEFKDVDRAIADGEEEGFVKVHVKKGTDKILGGTIVARHAGEMLSELTLAITQKIGLKKLSGVIHPYPTQAEAIRQLGDMYNRTLLTPTFKKILEKVFKRKRKV